MPDPSPRCPDCDYPIFGVRDMICPECGRKLDVRDFNLDMDDSEGHRRRLRRDGQIGVTLGLFALLVPTALCLLVAGLFLYYRAMPACVAFIVVVMIIWNWRVLAWIGREAMPAKKRKR